MALFDEILEIDPVAEVSAGARIAKLLAECRLTSAMRVGVRAK